MAEEPDSCLLLAQAPVLGDSGNGAPEEFGTSEDNKAAREPRRGVWTGTVTEAPFSSNFTQRFPDIRLAAPLSQHLFRDFSFYSPEEGLLKSLTCRPGPSPDSSTSPSPSQPP